MKTENWNNHNIRFVEHKDEWWAVAKDVCQALGLKQVTRALKGLDYAPLTTSKVGVVTGTRGDGTEAVQEVDMNIINEFSIYQLIFKSRKQEAKDFQRWVFNIIKTLRKSTGLEGFALM